MQRLPAEELWRRARRGEARTGEILERLPDGSAAAACAKLTARGYRFVGEMAEAQGEPERQVEIVRRYLGARAAEVFRAKIAGHGGDDRPPA